MKSESEIVWRRTALRHCVEGSVTWTLTSWGWGRGQVGSLVVHQEVHCEWLSITLKECLPISTCLQKKDIGALNS